MFLAAMRILAPDFSFIYSATIILM